MARICAEATTVVTIEKTWCVSTATNIEVENLIDKFVFSPVSEQ